MKLRCRSLAVVADVGVGPFHADGAAQERLVGCVAENDSRSLGQALRLVQSIRWFGGELAAARVRVCVAGGVDPAFQRALESYGAEVRVVSSSFQRDRENDHETPLWLECGTVVVQDPLPWVRRGSSGEMPVELDFLLDPSYLSPPAEYFAVDPAILRYHDRVDSEGYLLHTPYPFAQVRLEAFNRRLRQEREGLAGRARPVRERPAAPAAPAAQVVVLGMHRSGTSAVISLLRLMGLWAGEEDDFPPADEHNQAGYWEHRGVWSVDEAILRSLGASWSEAADLDLSRLGGKLGARLAERARETVRDLDRHGSWVVKDPRLCLLLPFWREILERPVCVLVHREPLPVARSLAARDGLPISYGIALWEQYTRAALASTQGLPRILISHRELMADPAATLRRLHAHLARHRPELAGLHVPSQEKIRAVLDPDLVHHPHDPETERLHLTPPQLELLDALADGSALDLDPVPPLSPGARDLLAAYPKLLAATTRGLRDELAAQSREAASQRRACENALADARAHENALTDALADAQAHENALTDALADAQAHANALAVGASDLQRALAWIDELDAIVSAILESRSWKMGHAITSAMRRLLGGTRTGAAERRDRLMAEVRKWRRGEMQE